MIRNFRFLLFFAMCGCFASGADARADNSRNCDVVHCALDQLLLVGKSEDPFFTVSAYAAASGVVGDLSGLSETQKSIFLQFYGTAAMISGDYSGADHWYPNFARHEAPKDKYNFAVPADQMIIDRAADARAVFFNELHGRAQSRTVLLALLPKLKAMGFTHLALETLAVSADYRDAVTCGVVPLDDHELVSRGAAVTKTGFYSRESIYGELIRTALQLGFELVGYDVSGDNQSERMEGGATILACLMKRDDKTKVVALAGMANIGEHSEAVVDDYSMAEWFKRKTGIDPVTVATYELVDFDASSVRNGSANMLPGFAYVLKDSNGHQYNSDIFDMSVYVHGDSDRNSSATTWLTLRGLRAPTRVSLKDCEQERPCLVSAMRASDPVEAVVSDRCVVLDPNQDSCNLYLPLGEFRINIYGADGVLRSAHQINSSHANP